MFQAPLIGIPHRFSAADTTVVGNVSSTLAQPNINLIGIRANRSVADKTTIQIWAGTTATTTAAGKPLSGLITFTTAQGAATNLLPFPAYCSGGCVVNIVGQSDITLYWNPAGG